MDIKTITREIAAALGDGWKAAPGWYEGPTVRDARLIGPEGEEIHVTMPTWPPAMAGRLNLSASYGADLRPHMPYNAKRAEITVSQAKSAAVIARDIERRLLPDLRNLLYTLRERKAQSDEYEAGRQTTLAAVLEALGGHGEAVTQRHGRETVEARIGRYGNPVHGDLEVMGDEVKFTLRVSLALAPELARCIATLLERTS